MGLSFPGRAVRWTAGGIGASVLLGTLAVYSYQVNSRQAPQPAGHIVSDEPAAPSPEEDYLYLLGTEAGRLAVFLRGEDEPQMVFDVPVRVLPEADQRLLAEGIRVKDYQTLVRRIEDYIS